MDPLIAFGLKHAAVMAVILTAIAAVIKTAFTAGRNAQRAKESKANEKALEAVVRANSARASANIDSVSSDGFRRD